MFSADIELIEEKEQKSKVVPQNNKKSRKVKKGKKSSSSLPVGKIGLGVFVAFVAFRIISSSQNVDAANASFNMSNQTQNIASSSADISMEKRKAMMEKHFNNTQRSQQTSKAVDPTSIKKTSIKTEKKAIVRPPLDSSPKHTTETTSNTDNTDNYVVTRKRFFASNFEKTPSYADILGDRVALVIDNSPYHSLEKIKNGFSIGKIEFRKGKTDRIKDILLHTSIQDNKNGDTIKEYNLPLSDRYSVQFFEDGIEISSKKEEKSTGVILPGESIVPGMKFISTEKTKDGFLYTVKLDSGDVVKESVPMSKIF